MRRIRDCWFRSAIVACMWLLSAIGATGSAMAQDPLPVVALMRVSGETAARLNDMFRQALREIGHEDGRTIRLVLYLADSRVEPLPDLARRVVATRPAVIIALGLPLARAMRAATSSIPIVAMSSLPVETKLVESLSRPGGNLTGVNILTSELDTKRLSLLSEFMPSARRIAILRDPASATADHDARLEAMARSLGVTLDFLDAGRADEIAPALRLAKSRGAEAVNVLASPMLVSATAEITATARETGLATMCQWREMAEAGCLMSYGPSFLESYRLTAKQMDRVLRGAKPAELPVEQPTHFELVVNLRTATAIGLAIAPSFLARADEVIE
jgi:putative ABC transport system substrate-binding protein